MTITRTAVQTVANQARQTWIDANRNAFKGQQWVATLDTRTCPVCGPLDGRWWAYGDEAGAEGTVAQMPSVPRHPACRCVTVPVPYSLEALEARARGEEILKPAASPTARASMDGEVAGTLTWEDWLSDQPAGVQQSVLGQSAWEEWKKTGLLEALAVTQRRWSGHSGAMRSVLRQHAPWRGHGVAGKRKSLRVSGFAL